MLNILSQLEKKVILLLRSLKPFEWIEIRMKDNRISVTVHSTVKEDFPVDNP